MMYLWLIPPVYLASTAAILYSKARFNLTFKKPELLWLWPAIIPIAPFLVLAFGGFLAVEGGKWLHAKLLEAGRKHRINAQDRARRV